MNLEKLELFELRSLYIKLFGKPNLPKHLEPKQLIPNNLPLYDIIEYYTQKIGKSNCKNYFINKIQPELNQRYLSQAKTQLDDCFNENFKYLFLSELDDLNQFQLNDLTRIKTKKTLVDKILLSSDIDTTNRPLVFFNSSLRCSGLSNSNVFFFQDFEFLIYQQKPQIAPHDEISIYSDLNLFQNDISDLILKLTPKNTNNYFNLGLLTFKDSKDTIPPSQNKTKIYELFQTKAA